MSSYEILASDCAPDIQCAKIVRRRVVCSLRWAQRLPDPAAMAALGVGLGEGAVDISEDLLLAAYTALMREAS